ncbi:MAG TPA: hypothetical protein VIL99_08290 [Ignavibacteria bacterium]
MKYLLSLLSILIFLSFAKTSYCQDDRIWTFICTSSTGENFYLDSLSIELSGDHIDYWDKATNAPDENKDFRMSKQRIYSATKEYITLQSFYISDIDGISGKNFPYGENNKAIVSGSVMETFYNYLYEKFWK